MSTQVQADEGQVVDAELDPRRWVVLGVLCLALLVVGIDGTIVNVALPTLVRELDAIVEPAAVDRRRLHDRVRQLPADRRQHRRPARSQAVLHRRSRDLRRRLVRLLAGRRRQRVDPVPRACRASVRRSSCRRRCRSSPTCSPTPSERAGRSRCGPACRASASPSDRSPAATCSSTSGGVPIFLVNVPIVIVAVIAARRRSSPSRGTSTLPRSTSLGTVLSIDRSDRPALRHHRGPDAGLDRPDRRSARFVVAVVLLTAFVFWERHTDHPILDVTFFANPRFTRRVDRDHARVLRHVRLAVLRQPVPAVRARLLGARSRAPRCCRSPRR